MKKKDDGRKETTTRTTKTGVPHVPRGVRSTVGLSLTAHRSRARLVGATRAQTHSGGRLSFATVEVFSYLVPAARFGPRQHQGAPAPVPLKEPCCPRRRRQSVILKGGQSTPQKDAFVKVRCENKECRQPCRRAREAGAAGPAHVRKFQRLTNEHPLPLKCQ